MSGRRSRRRRRLRAQAQDNLSSSPSPSSTQFSSSSPSSTQSSSSSERTDRRKIPLSSQLSKEGRRRPRDARVVRPLLLSLIRGYYIDAISRLPADELRTALARGLLVAGHCYGPLHPVLNIIVNAVWYSAAFPFRATDSFHPIHVDVITTEGISRLVRRSLDGLVASLRHHCPALSEDDALWHLCLSSATLHSAVAFARGAVPSFGRKEFPSPLVAAQAARHPNPKAFALFMTSVLPDVERRALSLLAGKRRLSSLDICHLSSMLLPFQLLDDDEPLLLPHSVLERSQKIIQIITERRNCYLSWYQTLLDIADAALLKFAHQTGAHYHLLTTYGQSILQVKDCHMDRYFHVNFMACPKGDTTRAPKRFFAEAHNPPVRNCSEEHITLCCMLVDAQPSASHVGNCYACVTNNQEIDHPNAEEHFGGQPYKMDEAEKHRGYPSTVVDVDYRFFDPERDIELMEHYADKIALVEDFRSKSQAERNDRSKDVASHTKPKYYIFAEDDSDDEDDEDASDEDVSIYCTRCV